MLKACDVSIRFVVVSVGSVGRIGHGTKKGAASTHTHTVSTYLRVDHVLQPRKVHRGRGRHAPVSRGLSTVGAPVPGPRPARRPRLLLRVRVVWLL